MSHNVDKKTRGCIQRTTMAVNQEYLFVTNNLWYESRKDWAQLDQAKEDPYLNNTCCPQTILMQAQATHVHLILLKVM